MGEELLDVFESIGLLRAEFEALARPAGLPPPGEPLPTIEEPAFAESVRPRGLGLTCYQGLDFSMRGRPPTISCQQTTLAVAPDDGASSGLRAH